MVENDFDTDRPGLQGCLFDILGDVAQRWTTQERRDQRHAKSPTCVGYRFDRTNHSERADRDTS